MRFPALTVTRAGKITRLADRTSLEVGYAGSLRSGSFEGMQLIDSKGQALRVRRATQLGGYGPLWGYSLFFTRRIRLQLDLDQAGTLNLSAVKDVVCKAMKCDPHLWESDISEDGVAGWQRKVRLQTSIRAVIALLPN